MKTPGLALTAALGFFVFWAATPAPAQQYKPEKWEECSDPKLAAAFEKLTGQKPWKVRWILGAFAKDPAQPPELHIQAAWVLGPPKQAGDRIEDGIAEYFHLAAEGDPKKSWWPGDRWDWWSTRSLPGPQAKFPSRYVVAKAKPETVTKGGEDLASRIYDTPVFADPEMSGGECLALIDKTFELGMSALHSSEPEEGDVLWDLEKKPYFGSLSSLTAKDPLQMFLRGIEDPQSCRIACLSQEGHGATVLIFRWENGEAKFETTTGLNF